MDLPALSGAASIALATTLLFALIVRGWQIVTERQGARHAYAAGIMNEAAQRIRDQWRQTGRRQSAYLVAGLVFLLVFVTAWLLQADPLLGALPVWQLIATLVVVGVAAGAAAFRLLLLLARRRQLRLRRDASLVTGHALQKLSGNLNRTFHDVPCSAGIVDHVVAGLHGIYAVHVVARRPGKDPRASLQGDEVHFASRHAPVSTAAFQATAKRLARECSKAVRHEVHIRCVVAVPGWEIGMQTGNDLLLVNERNISMLAGWKDQREYLLNEDVDVLQQLLTGRCTRIAARV
jgi:hypothetical protein